MAKILKIKEEMDVTGGGYTTVVVFYSEPTKAQQEDCVVKNYGMEWANGETVLPPEYIGWSAQDTGQATTRGILSFVGMIVTICGFVGGIWWAVSTFILPAVKAVAP